MRQIVKGDRVRKRGLGFLGVVIAVVPLGVRVRWDDGSAARMRPSLCAPGELELEEEPEP
jgi:hypothetical protein